MKRLITATGIFGIANLNPQKSGLGNIVIWSDHGGITRKVSHKNTPRIKLSIGDDSIVVTISDAPKRLDKKKIDKNTLSKFKPGIDYVARNYDLFLKHYFDTDFEFDDEDLFRSLRDRGEYK